MHNLSSVYSVTITPHVSGLLVAHHQDVTVYICDGLYVLYVLVDSEGPLTVNLEVPFATSIHFTS
jgi:hypothetical protein